MSGPRFRPAALVDFATGLFAAAGLDGDKPEVVARHLVEADLLGHTTHGLQLAGPYLAAAADGGMTLAGEPEVVGGRGAALAWDGRRLPGVWLTVRAVDAALERACEHGVGAVSIRNSHHIGCLAVFLERATSAGMLVQLTCSDPSTESVAPYGGLEPVMTPNPLAIGIPTGGDPILVDVSASITTNGLAARLHGSGGRFPGPWAIDAEGTATDDPAVLFADPVGTLLPTGGVDHGHKGYGLGLTVEAFTQGLSGHGRADAPTGWGASVFVQVLDPGAFGGTGPFVRQTAWLAERCRSTRAAPGVEAVRLPGDRGLARKRRALAEGLVLHEGIFESLVEHAGRLGVAVPDPG